MPNTTWSTTDKSANCTLSSGNLTATGASATAWARAADKQITGKFYFEITAGATFASSSQIGVAIGGVTPGSALPNGAACVVQGGVVFVNATNTGVTVGAVVPSNVVCVAVDIDAKLLWFRIGAAGNWNGNAGFAPNTGVGGVNISAAVPGPAFAVYPYVYLNVNPSAVTANFGDTAFVGAVPSGYTSGFTAGASVPTNALASQALAEHWMTTNPQAQITQVILEHWMSVAEGVPVVPSLDTRVMVLA